MSRELEAGQTTEGIDRRQFLGALLALPLVPRALESLAEESEGGGVKDFLAEAEQLHEQLASRVHMPGETVDWVVPIEISPDEWKVTVAKPALRRFLKAQPKINLRFFTNNTLNDQESFVGTFSNSLFASADDLDTKFLRSDEDLLYRVRPALTTDQADNQHYDQLILELAPTNDPFDGEISTGVPYRVNWYRRQSAVAELVDPTRDRVVGEVPIGDELYDLVDSQVRLFSGISVGKTPVVLITSPSAPRNIVINEDFAEGNASMGEDVITVNKRMLVPTELASDVNAPPDGRAQMVVDHELAHIAFFAVRENPEFEGRLKQFEKLYARIWKQLGVKAKDKRSWKVMNACAPEYAELYQLFDESTYMEGIVGCETGHPADRADELFASALNVMRRFPGEFKQRLATMDDNNKELAQAVKTMVLDTVEQLAEVTNGTTAAAHTLIPELENLRAL